jgi:hypothetical protein
VSTPAGTGPLPDVLAEVSLQPVAQAPLAAGTVQAVRADGGSVYVRLRYVLRRALPMTELSVRLLVHPFDPTGTNRPFVFLAVPLGTDASGDGTTEVSVRHEEVPLSVRGAEHGLRWEVALSGEVVYRSDCTPVILG